MRPEHESQFQVNFEPTLDGSDSLLALQTERRKKSMKFSKETMEKLLVRALLPRSYNSFCRSNSGFT